MVTELQTAGYATVRRLSTCIMYYSAHTGSNTGCEENGFQLKEKERRRGAVRKMERREKWENISSSNSFALIWIPSEMSGEVGQWDLESLCCFFFFFFFLPLSTYSLVNGKWAMRLGEGKMMSYGEWVNKSKRKKERKPRQAEWWFGASLGSLTSWLRHPDKEGERRGEGRERFVSAL